MAKKKRLIIVFGLVIILSCGLFALTRTGFGRHMIGKFYTGPHLRCNLTMTVDGKPYVPDASAVTGLPLDNGTENTVSDFKALDSGCKFCCKGHEYGNQPFQITVQTAEMQTPCVIPVKVIVSDNWRMTKLELNISINTNDGTYTYDAQADMSGDVCSSSGENPMDGITVIRISNI